MGVPSVFIRASGCNLRCQWCDTPYASWEPQGQQMPVAEIVSRVEALTPAVHPGLHVVITGGEPMIMPEIEELCLALKERGKHVTMETAGTLWKAVRIDLASVSPKLANSTPLEREGGRFAKAHEAQRINIPVIQKFIDESPDVQVKFVVSSESDLDEIDSIVGQLTGITPQDVLLMPEGVDAETLRGRAPWIGEVCKRRGYRYCPRLHVEMYGNRRGT